MPAKSRKKPVVARAVKFLRDYIASHNLKPGDKLPPLVRLSAEADVSYVTMVRVMRELRHEGAVALINNHSYAVAGPGHPQEKSDGLSASGPLEQQQKTIASVRKAWQRTADQIREDIVNRVYRPGAVLPSVKELSARYRISYRTLKKSLQQLADENILTPMMNGGYALPSFAAPGWRSRIICICQSLDSWAMSFGQNGEAVYREMETLCAHAGIAIDILLFFLDAESKQYKFRKKDTGEILQTIDLPHIGDTLGFLFMTHLNPHELEIQALHALFLTKKPIAVLDETSMLTLPKTAQAMRRGRIFSASAGSGPGRIVGRHLLDLGHRKIAFISMYHEYSWSRLRLQGLQSVFSEAGIEGGVILFVKEAAVHIVEHAALRSNFETLKNFYVQWSKDLPADYKVDFDTAIEEMRWNTQTRSEMRSLLNSVLDSALSDSQITAWVFVNDYSASLASDYLARKSIRIPADLSIISFDDTPEALRKSYSSFNFNAPAVAAAAAGFLLGKKPYNDPVFSVHGFIVNRGSTAMAKSIAQKRPQANA